MDSVSSIWPSASWITYWTAHAFAEAIKIAPRLSKDTIIAVDSCGDAKKDMKIIKERLGRNLWDLQI